MSGPTPGSPRDPRLEELLKINASLAAEVRNLTAGRADAPRVAGMPTSRRLARLADRCEELSGERDELIERRLQLEGELEAARAARVELERQNAELTAEIHRLRIGMRGILRRLRARLLAPR